MTLLSVQNISAHYGAAQALFDVSFEIGEGEVVAMMGRNGMGKSTTVKTICKLLPLTSGRIRFKGHDLAHSPPHKAARMGIGLVPEGRRCFASLSVTENLIASARKGYWDLPKVTQLFPRLAERHNQSAASLSGGEQQMLAIGRALMTNPSLLVLDEATEGLAPLVRHEIWRVLADLKRDTNLAILVIDKSLKELTQIADKAVIIERGETVWTGHIADATSDISARFLGV